MDSRTSLFLAHYGVKGMRWGFRKRDDGSVVKTGRTAKSRSANESEDHKQAQTLKKKRPSEMSNAELKKLNERMQLEVNYAQLMGKQKTKVSKGQKVVKEMVGVANTARQVAQVVNSPEVKAIRKALST